MGFVKFQHCTILYMNHDNFPPEYSTQFQTRPHCYQYAWEIHGRVHSDKSYKNSANSKFSSVAIAHTTPTMILNNFLVIYHVECGKSPFINGLESCSKLKQALGELPATRSDSQQLGDTTSRGWRGTVSLIYAGILVMTTK
jgi:hypothetical protein